MKKVRDLDSLLLLYPKGIHFDVVSEVVRDIEESLKTNEVLITNGTPWWFSTGMIKFCGTEIEPDKTVWGWDDWMFAEEGDPKILSKADAVMKVLEGYDNDLIKLCVLWRRKIGTF